MSFLINPYIYAGALAAISLITSSPIIDVANFSVNGVIAANQLLVGSPIIGTPALTQKHTLGASNLNDSSPIVGFSSIVVIFDALDLIDSSPNIDPAIFSANGEISANQLTVGSPVIDSAVLTYGNVLNALDLIDSSTVIDPGVLSPNGILAANQLTIGSPSIGTPSINQNPGYANPGGTGARNSIITVSSALTISSGAVVNLVDGDLTANSTHSFSQGAVTAQELIFDFRLSGFYQIINEFKWYQDTAQSHGTWDFDGFDGTSWTNLLAGLTLGGAATSTYSFGNSTAYILYRLKQKTGTTSNTPWCKEIEFKISAGSAWTSVGDYTNNYSTGNRTSLITVTTTLSLLSGSASATVDGTTGSGGMTPSATQNLKEVKFDFGSGNARTVTNLKLYSNSTASFGHWRLNGSNDDSTYVELGGTCTNFAVNGNAEFPEMCATNRAAYRYYKLVQCFGSTAANPHWEYEFKIV